MQGELPTVPIPADSATDVPVRYPDEDAAEEWYDPILREWQPGPVPYGNDELYRRTLVALTPTDDEDDNPAHVGEVS